MKRSTFRIAAVLLAPSLLVVATWAVQGRPPEEASPQQAAPAGKIEAVKISVLESLPNRFQARTEQRKRTLSQVPPAPSLGLAPKAVLNLTKRWSNGQTIKIAFKGGSEALHKQIADVASGWTQFANLHFDFGVDPATGKYRAWKPSDADFTADIRVSFDQPGYYSLVGRDSVDRIISRPNEESLNLQGFDQSLPADWKGVTLHEFGHAIGFEHEHQGPAAMCDFRFDDDPGYVPTTDDFGQYIPDPAGKRPGIYTQLGGPPNNWPQAVVDHNLRNLPASSAYDEGPFDKNSIMKYFFEDYMFVAGRNSPCFTDTENVVLSALDKQGAARVYPRASAAIAADDELRAKVFDQLAKAQALPETLKRHYHKLREQIKR
jgi:hypothetical protein